MTAEEQCSDIIARLSSLANPSNIAGMSRFGINSFKTLGIPVNVLRQIAKESGCNQDISLLLWQTQIHEARILAGYLGIPGQVKEVQMEQWAGDFDSWDICDQVCSNLFALSPLAYSKAVEWSRKEKEFEKRAGYVLMASLAVKDKKAGDDKFVQFFGLIEAGSIDRRNYVKKAVNWALRQIGKRNINLNRQCLELAQRIHKLDSPSAHWDSV